MKKMEVLLDYRGDAIPEEFRSDPMWEELKRLMIKEFLDEVYHEGDEERKRFDSKVDLGDEAWGDIVAMNNHCYLADIFYVTSSEEKEKNFCSSLVDSSAEQLKCVADTKYKLFYIKRGEKLTEIWIFEK